MATLLDSVRGQISQDFVRQVGAKLGTDPQATSRAIDAALPMLLGGVARQAQSPQGASGLWDMLDRNHDGSVLDDLAGMLGGASAAGAPATGGSAGRGAASGSGLPGGLGGAGDILGQIFGSKTGNLSNSLGRSSGLSPALMTQLLSMLAPLVLGAVGKAKRTQGLDAGGLAGMLAGEQNHLEAAVPGSSDMLGKLLDADGDGSIVDDLAEKGASLFRSFFGNR